jgi:endonuclease/exonuclease/phosphatase family metal-dependent hydrolase
MANAIRTALLSLPAIFLMAACSRVDTESTVEGADIELRVMTFNIEWGGTHVSFDNVVRAIRQSGADVVGIQEAEGNLQRLASRLGWHFNERNYAISRYPLLEPPGADGRYVLVETEPGKVVALSNVHLPSDPYGVDMVRDGASAAEVLDIERRTRLPKIVPTLETLKPLIEAQVPVFLTGDFNAPAHTDWTEDMVGARPFLRFPLAWPVSLAVAEAGFVDSWRDVHPDPRTNPGLTWWARRPPLEAYAPGANDAEDRIDFIWYAGPAKAIASEIAGEAGTPEVSIAVDPWPSDHRAVVSTFLARPADVPVLVTTGRRIYQQGEDVEVLYRQAPEARILIQHASIGDHETIETSGSISGDGSLVFPAHEFAPGHYRVYMTESAGDAQAKEFWVVDPDAVPEVAVVGSEFYTGEAIEIVWQNAPGYRNDYVALVEQGASTQASFDYSWLYMGALPQGRAVMDALTAEWTWPLPPGTYVARLMKDDGYDILAESAPFTIR